MPWDSVTTTHDQLQLSTEDPPLSHTAYGVQTPFQRVTLARNNRTEHATTRNNIQPSDRTPTTACCDLRQSQYRQQENKRRADTRRHTASSLAARRSSTAGEPTVSRATAWLSREGIVCALRRPPAEHRRQRGPPTHAVSGDIGRRQPMAGSAATTRDTMGLTTPSPLAFKAGHNRFSHDLRQLGQLVQLLSYNPRP